MHNIHTADWYTVIEVIIK